MWSLFSQCYIAEVVFYTIERMGEENKYKFILEIIGLLSGFSLINWLLVRHSYKLKKTKMNNAEINDTLETLSNISNSKRKGIINHKEASELRNKVLKTKIKS